jgi:hypothetical protein
VNSKMPIPKNSRDPSGRQRLFEAQQNGSKQTTKSIKKQQKALLKELKEAAAKRKTPMFNAKGELTANAEEKKKPAVKKKATAKKKPAAKKTEAKKTEAKKTEAKKPAAKKTEAKKPAAKKTEAKKPAAKKTEAKKPAAKKTEAKKKVVKKKVVKKKVVKKKVVKKKVVKKKAVKKPSKLLQSLKAARGKPPTPKTTQSKMRQSLKAARGKPPTPKGTTIGPAGERIGGNTSVKKGGRLASVGKNLLRFGGPLAALSVGASVYNAVHPDKVKKRTGESKAGFGTKKEKKKPITSAATATTVANASQTSSESTQGASSSSQSSSFGAAFKKARKAGKSKFSWNGKSYSTVTKDEVKKSGSKNLREHLNKQNKKKSK